MDDGSPRDNKTYTATVLCSGWILGVLLGLSVMFVGRVPTTAAEWVPLPTASPTPTPTAFFNLTNATLSPTPTPTQVSTLVAMNEEFEVAGTALLTIGIMILPTSLIAITLYRRTHDESPCSEDRLGIGTAAIGTISGLMFVVGIMFLSGTDTSDSVALGVFLLILSLFGVAILVMLSKCYNNYYETKFDTF